MGRNRRPGWADHRGDSSGFAARVAAVARGQSEDGRLGGRTNHALVQPLALESRKTTPSVAFLPKMTSPQSAGMPSNQSSLDPAHDDSAKLFASYCQSSKRCRQQASACVLWKSCLLLFSGVVTVADPSGSRAGL